MHDTTVKKKDTSSVYLLQWSIARWWPWVTAETCRLCDA